MAKETTAQRLARMEGILRSHGFMVDDEVATSVEDRADYIAHGSPEHATFLGLVEVQGNGNGEYQTFTGSKKRAYRLDDELLGMKVFPGVDPEKATSALLRQKVGELEAGVPPIPETAPPMWRPRDEEI